MKSLRENKEHIEARVHHDFDKLRDRASEEAQQIKKSMHRRPLGGGGEWDRVDPKDHNIHQRIAAKTNGWLTAANLVTTTGAALTAAGMAEWFRGKNKRGTVLMGIGRGLDLLDGAIAQRTGTISDKGAALDAGSDKLLATAFIGLAAQNGDMPVAEAAAHGLQQTRIFRESLLIKNAGGEPNPSEYGKRGMAALWLRAGGIVLGKTLEDAGHERGAVFVHRASQALGITALYLNQQAIEGYTTERITAQHLQPYPTTETTQ